MTAITKDTDYQIIDCGVGGMGGVKTLLVRCINTVDATNTLAITLADFGIAPTGFIGIVSWVHTTDNSVSALETNTTSVTSGVLTITIGAGTDNDSRFILVYGLSNKPAAASAL